MEENNKQQLEQDMQESVNEETKEQGTPLRSSIIMLLAGVYLLYTGYKLCQDVLNGTNGSSWGFFAAGVGFLIRRSCDAGCWMQRSYKEREGKTGSRGCKTGTEAGRST